MFLSYFTLFTALSLSMVAAWYSILGLTAIFASAVIPIIIMGSILEVAKVTVTVWLHEYWHRCRLLMRIYLVPAVFMLMVITSMGIFGFLSKAHSDQSLVSGDVLAKIAVYDEKIKVSKDNIDANRRALKQMDEAEDQVMGRSQDEKGADKAVSIRRAQAKERTRLLAEIAAEQKTITALSEQRAPIAAEVRKVEEPWPMATSPAPGETEQNRAQVPIPMLLDEDPEHKEHTPMAMLRPPEGPNSAYFPIAMLEPPPGLLKPIAHAPTTVLSLDVLE
jgi:hypothetical protein